MANTAWAFATLGIEHPTLMATISEFGVRGPLLVQCKAPELAGLAWAYAAGWEAIQWCLNN